MGHRFPPQRHGKVTMPSPVTPAVVGQGWGAPVPLGGAGGGVQDVRSGMGRRMGEARGQGRTLGVGCFPHQTPSKTLHGAMPSGCTCSSLPPPLRFSPNPTLRVTLPPPGWGCLASTSQAKGVRIKGPPSVFEPPSLCLQHLGGAEPPNLREERQPLKVGDPRSTHGSRAGWVPSPPQPTALLALPGREQPSPHPP